MTTIYNRALPSFSPNFNTDVSLKVCVLYTCHMEVSIFHHLGLDSLRFSDSKRRQREAATNNGQKKSLDISRTKVSQALKISRNLQSSPTRLKRNKTLKQDYKMTDFIHFFCNMYFDIMLSFILRPRGTDDYELVTIKSEIVCELLSM